MVCSYLASVLRTRDSHAFVFGVAALCLASGVGCGGSDGSDNDSDGGQASGATGPGDDSTGGETGQSQGNYDAGHSVDGTGGQNGTKADSGAATGETGGSGGATGGSGSGDPTATSPSLYGDPHEGQFHLGPVDFAQTEWSNACTPEGGYKEELREASGLGGEYLAGVSSELSDGGAICDSCIQVTTGSGRSIVARVVTYGSTKGVGDIDVSPSVYDAINPEDASPRPMTWRLAKCPETGTLRYEWQTGANVWWTSLWVRNQRVPLAKAEVQSKNHPEFTELRRASDGTLNDDDGFGEGAFTLRLTAVDGQVITDSFDSFEPGSVVVSDKQFE